MRRELKCGGERESEGGQTACRVSFSEESKADRDQFAAIKGSEGWSLGGLGGLGGPKTFFQHSLMGPLCPSINHGGIQVRAKDSSRYI